MRPGWPDDAVITSTAHHSNGCAGGTGLPASPPDQAGGKFPHPRPTRRGRRDLRHAQLVRVAQRPGPACDHRVLGGDRDGRDPRRGEWPTGLARATDHRGCPVPRRVSERIDPEARLRRRMEVRGIPGVSVRVARGGTTHLYACDLGTRNLGDASPLRTGDRSPGGVLDQPVVGAGGPVPRGESRTARHRSGQRVRPRAGGRSEQGRITVGQLLAHTSGLPRGDYHEVLPPAGETLRPYRSDTSAVPPGNEYKYSNWGYFLLGCVIEAVTGEVGAVAHRRDGLPTTRWTIFEAASLAAETCRKTSS